MTKINKFLADRKDEVEGGKEYAERYLECKAKNNMAWANKYKEMAGDELKHAGYINDMLNQEMKDLAKVYTAPLEKQEEWDKANREYVEMHAWVKQMLTM